ncbi:YqhV family protein [Lederbergia citrea]|uniref:YqhV family protein n=1 Tax=Lederbergia citrea TaxID=2833581 RepID=A0A942UL17_9BACI|nr:YqhV family protein [Lederbergia citrea]MBS4176122.1 YqhV family protein [Lederbergia citrea]MBS4202682.1 YqhV family protein [Lederbergia citrea]MBS4222650.1 YqhV family protein [Lederbergia citrea]
MITFLEKAVIGMAFLRLLSGSVELFAAFLMIRFNDIEKALVINSSLALIGPIILIITTAIGLLGMADRIQFGKIIWVFLGVGFILYGLKSS